MQIRPSGPGKSEYIISVCEKENVCYNYMGMQEDGVVPPGSEVTVGVRHPVSLN